MYHPAAREGKYSICGCHGEVPFLNAIVCYPPKDDVVMVGR